MLKTIHIRSFPLDLEKPLKQHRDHDGTKKSKTARGALEAPTGLSLDSAAPHWADSSIQTSDKTHQQAKNTHMGYNKYSSKRIK